MGQEENGATENHNVMNDGRADKERMEPREETQEIREPKPAAKVRPRVLLLLLVTQFVFLWWTADSEIARSVYLIPYALIIPAMLFLLIARLLERRLPFERHELLLVYI